MAMLKEPEVAWFICGYLSGRMQVDMAGEHDISLSVLVTAITKFCQHWAPKQHQRYSYSERRELIVIALGHYLSKGRPVTTPPVFETRWDLRTYVQAQAEHIYLLSCEGLKFTQIARRLGLSSTRVQQSFGQFTYKMRKATKRTHYCIETHAN